MISLEEASNEISEIITRLLPGLEKKYFKVEHHGASVRCINENGDTIELRAIPDHARNSLSAPMSSGEYQSQGGHKELINKIDRHNSDAWKIDLKKTTSGSHYEIHFPGCESDWDSARFEKEFSQTF